MRLDLKDSRIIVFQELLGLPNVRAQIRIFRATAFAVTRHRA